ncbi:hypothetical protein QBE52_12040 [Clostridiaceae bacterium 35-E11]
MIGIIHACKNALNRKKNCAMDAISESLLEFYQKHDVLWNNISKIIIVYSLFFALFLVANIHVVNRIIKSLTIN